MDDHVIDDAIDDVIDDDYIDDVDIDLLMRSIPKIPCDKCIVDQLVHDKIYSIDYRQLGIQMQCSTSNTDSYNTCILNETGDDVIFTHVKNPEGFDITDIDWSNFYELKPPFILESDQVIGFKHDNIFLITVVNTNGNEKILDKLINESVYHKNITFIEYIDRYSYN